MDGQKPGYFVPNANITRAEVITIFYKLEGKPVVDTSKSLFPDVFSSNWYYAATIWGKTNGIITGMSSGENAGKFMPKNQITRQDFVKILYEYAKFKKCDTSVKSSTSYTAVPDANDISKYARESMNWAFENGLIAQGSDFSPKREITRKEVAVILASFLIL